MYTILKEKNQIRLRHVLDEKFNPRNVEQIPVVNTQNTFIEKYLQW